MKRVFAPIFLAAMVALFLAGCTAADKLPNIREGMSQAEVEGVFGAPDGFRRAGDFTAIEYKDEIISGWGMNRADYGFVFENDRLVSWGAGEVRQHQVGGVNTLFVYGLN